MKHHIAMICVALAFAAVVSAEESPIRVKVRLDGRLSQLIVAPKDTREVIFFAETSGNISVPFNVVLDAPKGTRIEASMATIRDTAARQLKRERDFWNVSLMSRKQLAKFESGPCLEFLPSSETEVPKIDRPVSNDPLCNIFSDEEMNSLAEALKGVYGGNWSRGQVCGYLMKYYFGGAGDCLENDPVCEALKNGDVPQGQSFRMMYASVGETIRIERYGLIRKNTCADEHTRYLLRFKVDLSRIDPDKVPTATLRLQAMQFRFSGSMAATLKPVSDGRYAPQPIVLMSFLGSFCGSRLNVVSWKNGKPGKVSAARLGDLIHLNGYIFTRGPVGALLRGGKGTFELFNGRHAYGVCFDLAKRRQNANGYEDVRF